MGLVDLPLSGDQDISDHRPMWIKCRNIIWGPKSFEVFECWYDHPDFTPSVQHDWSSFIVNGSAAHILNRNFQLLRERLCWWNTNVFGRVDLQIDGYADSLNNVELAFSENDFGVTLEDLAVRSNVQQQFWEKLHTKESMLHQKT
ncbi:unnamed protein product [Lathyrus sativus]|nr:unnamed protein product [Lathyrus sativus]